MKLKVISLAVLLMVAPARAPRHADTLAAAPVAACSDAVSIKIRDAINNMYGNNLQEPNLRFRERRPGADVAAAIEREIATSHNVTPDADADDYSFVYTIKEKQGPRAWKLCISMVGRFATLFVLSKFDQGGRGKIVGIVTASNDAAERHIIQTVTAKGYVLLNKPTLACPTTVKMPNTSIEGSVKFWHALFRDAPGMPL